MAGQRPPVAKPSVPRQKPAIPSKPFSPLPPPKPCSKPLNDADDDSDDEDEYGYIHPETHSGDLANLIREAGGLPICVKVISTPQGRETVCQGGDTLMIHCLDQEQVVKAVEPTGNTFYLPVHSNQLYQILPLDPRLDGKEYRGTMELVKANPLPKVVRVLIGYFDEKDEDDTKEQDDIITIEGVEKGYNDELYLTGKIMGEAQRFRAMEDEAVYTTQIISEHLPISEVIKHKLPVRVRTVSTESPSKGRHKEFVFRLENLIKRERVIATSGRDGAIFSFPFSTPLKLDRASPPWSSITSMITPLYPLLNTSMCLKSLTEVILPRKAMKAVPQPKKDVLKEWLQSPEAKTQINDIAEQDNLEMQKKVASLMEDLKRAESELKHYKIRRPPPAVPEAPARPPKSPQEPHHRPSSLDSLPGSPLGSHTSSPSGQEPRVPSMPSSNARTNSLDEVPGVYDEVTTERSSPRTSISLASTDLEKELKNLLGEKILEIQTKEKEYRSLQERHKILESKFNKQTKNLSDMEEQLEALKDQEDCYDIMTPGLKNNSKSSSGKEHHILPKPPPKETSLKKKLTLKPPNMPLPSVPASKAMSSPAKRTGPKHPREEYDPLPVPMLDKGDISQRPPMKSPIKTSASVRFPLPTEPLELHSSGENFGSTTLLLSQQTDSFKRSMTTRPSHQHSVSALPHSVVRNDAAITPPAISEYDLPDLPPPLPPLPGPRNTQSSNMSKSSVYDLPPNTPFVPLSPDHSFNPVLYATPNSDLNTFTKEDVAVLLKSLNLDNCVSRFLKESVDGILLMSIDEEMMIKELGMTSFQARKLTIKIDELTSR